MSQPKYRSPARTEDNPLALPGLLLAILIGPIGLVVSLIAVTRRPRGVAVAGVIVGSLTTLTLLTVTVVVIVMVNRGRAIFEQYGALDDDITEVTGTLSTLHAESGTWPDSLTALGLTEDLLTDPWGQPYRYELTPDGANWVLSSAGPDGEMETRDDLRFDRFMPHAELYLARETTHLATSLFGAPSVVDESMSGVMNMARLKKAAQEYSQEHGEFPEAIEEVPGLVDWMLLDPWGQHYAYEVTEGRVRIRSAGADGRLGTADDLDSEGNTRINVSTGNASATPAEAD